MAREHIQVLRKMLQSDRGVILPGAPNALAARVVADLGFSAVYLKGGRAHQYIARSPRSRLFGSISSNRAHDGDTGRRRPAVGG
jgi:hypothetical protein